MPPPRPVAPSFREVLSAITLMQAVGGQGRYSAVPLGVLSLMGTDFTKEKPCRELYHEGTCDARLDCVWRVLDNEVSTGLMGDKVQVHRVEFCEERTRSEITEGERAALQRRNVDPPKEPPSERPIERPDDEAANPFRGVTTTKEPDEGGIPAKPNELFNKRLGRMTDGAPDPHTSSQLFDPPGLDTGDSPGNPTRLPCRTADDDKGELEQRNGELGVGLSHRVARRGAVQAWGLSAAAATTAGLAQRGENRVEGTSRVFRMGVAADNRTASTAAAAARQRQRDAEQAEQEGRSRAGASAGWVGRQMEPARAQEARQRGGRRGWGEGHLDMLLDSSLDHAACADCAGDGFSELCAPCRAMRDVPATEGPELPLTSALDDAGVRSGKPGGDDVGGGPPTGLATPIANRYPAWNDPETGWAARRYVPTLTPPTFRLPVSLPPVSLPTSPESVQQSEGAILAADNALARLSGQDKSSKQSAGGLNDVRFRVPPPKSTESGYNLRLLAPPSREEPVAAGDPRGTAAGAAIDTVRWLATGEMPAG